jgi:hypothetical protein
MVPLDIIAEQESRAAVGRGRMAVKRQAHRVRQHRLERDRVQTKLQNLEASNPFLNQGDLSRTTTSWLFLVYVLAAFGVDFALSGAVIQELTNSGDQLLWRTVLTLMLVIAECTVSIRRYLARVSAQPFSMGSYTTMTRLGVMIALVMPCLVLATQLARFVAEEKQSASAMCMVILTIVGLTFLSLALHGLLLASGRELYEAKIYMAASLRRGSLERRIARANGGAEQAFADTEETLVTYEDARRAHNARFPHSPIEAGPFDVHTIDILNQIYGRNTTAPRPPDSPGTSAPDSSPEEPGFRSGEDELRP